MGVGAGVGVGVGGGGFGVEEPPPQPIPIATTAIMHAVATACQLRRRRGAPARNMHASTAALTGTSIAGSQGALRPVGAIVPATTEAVPLAVIVRVAVVTPLTVAVFGVMLQPITLDDGVQLNDT